MAEISCEGSLTVAIPVYERMTYFAEALASAVEQSIRVSILVVDNASSHDGFRVACEASPHPSLRYVRNDSNLGMEGNWNVCIDECQTPYLTILHDDDVLSLKFAEYWFREVHARGIEFWASGHEVGPSPTRLIQHSLLGGNGPHESFGEDVFSYLPEPSPVPRERFRYRILSPFPGIVFRSDTTLRFDPNFHPAADTLFWFRLSQNQTPYISPRTILAFYRVSADQSTWQVYLRILHQHFRVRQIIRDELGTSPRLDRFDDLTSLAVAESYEARYGTLSTADPYLNQQLARIRERFTPNWRRLLARIEFKLYRRLVNDL